MVASEEEETLGVLDFIGEQQTDTVQGLFSPIYVVSQKKIVALCGRPEYLENVQEILELAMCITTDLHGGIQFQQHRLFDEDIFDHDAQPFDIALSDGEASFLERWLGDLDDEIINVDGLFLLLLHF